MAVSQVSFSKTPQAKDDFFANRVTEDSLSTVLDVLGNDSGGNARSLYSLASGGNAGSNERDLLGRDTARSSSTSGDLSALGARIWITADGKVGYDGSAITGRFQSLAVGQYMDDTFTYAVQMGNGTISTATVTIRIAGTNDGPQITSAAQTGAATEDQALSASGQVTASDVDNGDHQHYSVSGSAAGTYGSFSVDAASGVWTYTLANGAANVQALAPGERHVENFMVRVTDDHGAYVEQAVSIQVSGTNDGPVITSTEQSGAAKEDEILGATGQVSASDVDNGDHQHYAIEGNAAGTYGSISVDADSGQWSYALANGAANVQALAQGESHTETFTVRVTDDFGAMADQTVAVTITGTNDRPIITSELQSGAVAEDMVLAANGQVAASDVDNGDHQHYAVHGDASGTYGSIAVDADSGQWAYNLAGGAANVQALAEGEAHIETFTVRAADDFGAFADQAVAVTVFGTNDGPVITSDVQLGAVLEDLALVTGGHVTASDVDNGDRQHFSVLGLASGAFGAFAVDANTGEWKYALANGSLAVQALARGEKHDELFTVRVTDNFGAMATQLVTVTVAGTNDAPLVAAALSSKVTEDDEAFTIDLLAFASDIDRGFVLHASGLTEVNGKGGWSLDGDVITITPQAFGDDLNTGDFENLSFAYQVVDEHGAAVEQSLAVSIQGITDAPSLDVETSAGARVNEIMLTIASEPADGERVALTFSDLPAGARIYNAAGQDVTAGLASYRGSSEFKLVLAPDQDASADLTVTVTGYRPDGTPIKSTVASIDLDYDVASAIQAVNFSANDQNVWGDFTGKIQFHEYLPIIGGAPIYYDSSANGGDGEWKEQDAEYWHAGEATLVDAKLDTAKILDIVNKAATAVLNGAKQVFDVTANAISSTVENTFRAAQTEFTAARDKFFYAAREVDQAVRNAFQQAQSDYYAVKAGYDQASYDFNVWATGLHNDAWNRWQGNERWWNGLSDWDKGLIWNWAPRAFEWGLWTAADAAYRTAKVVWDGIKWGFEVTATGLYNAALTVYNTAVGAANAVAQAAWDGAQETFNLAKEAYEGAKKLVYDAAAAIYNTAQQGVSDTLKAVSDNVDFDSQLTVNADVFARAGLQVDIVLDIGSADMSLDYELTSMTRYNQTTDMLSITPTMVNKTTGDMVAFDTLSPNAQFYIAMLYDAGANLEVLIDGHLTVSGLSIYDLTPGTDQPGRIAEALSPKAAIAELKDLFSDLGVPTGDLDALDAGGKLVLVDFDSRRGDPPLGGFELPLVGTLTQDIVAITVAWPNVETEGTMAGPDPTKPAPVTATQIENSYREGGLVAVDFSEITDSLFNLVTARLQYSPELHDLVPGLAPLQQVGNFDELVASALQAFTGVLLDVLDGQSEETPIFLLDATDHTNASLIHVQLLPDDLSTFNANTGSFGFYSAYGETNPVALINIDIDQLIAVIVNEIVETALEAASQGTAIAILEALPSINPADITIGLDTILKVLQVGQADRDRIGEFLDLNINVQAVDVDVYADAKFSQKFGLSIDDMSYLVTLEDGEMQTFTARGAGSLTINDASSHDANGDGSVAYTLDIVPTAMFSNDTELKLGVGYVLDFLKGSVGAGIKLPLGQLLGINAGWLTVEVPLVDVAVGPLLRVQGDLDVIDIDLFESRFAVDAGSDSYDGAVNIQLAGINTAAVPA